VCISSFWATFWSAIKEGNASNAQNLVLQWEIKGFWAPPSPREGAESLDSDHLNTLFLRRSVHFIILGSFGALSRKEMRPTLKTLFYNAKSKVLGLPPAHAKVRKPWISTI
jgi:hypothetical protein